MGTSCRERERMGRERESNMADDWSVKMGPTSARGLFGCGSHAFVNFGEISSLLFYFFLGTKASISI